MIIFDASVFCGSFGLVINAIDGNDLLSYLSVNTP